MVFISETPMAPMRPSTVETQLAQNGSGIEVDALAGNAVAVEEEKWPPSDTGTPDPWARNREMAPNGSRAGRIPPLSHDQKGERRHFHCAGRERLGGS